MSPLPHDYGTNLAIWAALWSTLWLWQLACALSPALPSFGTLVRLLRSWWPTRWGLLGWWAWLGWHLFVRTSY